MYFEKKKKKVIFTIWKDLGFFFLQMTVKIIKSRFSLFCTKDSTSATQRDLSSLSLFLGLAELWPSLHAVPLARMEGQPIHRFSLEVFISHTSHCCFSLWLSQQHSGASSSHQPITLAAAAGCPWQALPTAAHLQFFWPLFDCHVVTYRAFHTSQLYASDVAHSPLAPQGVTASSTEH